MIILLAICGTHTILRSLGGGPTAGALLRLEHGSYEGMIAFSGATVIIGSFFMLWSRIRINPRLLEVV